MTSGNDKATENSLKILFDNDDIILMPFLDLFFTVTGPWQSLSGALFFGSRCLYIVFVNEIYDNNMIKQ